MKEINWGTVAEDLNEKGYSVIRKVLLQNECQQLIEQYGENSRYRSIINMERYRFGRGEYKYFTYPLPHSVQSIRESFYTPLADVANQWMTKLNINVQFPREHEKLIQECNHHDQSRPTPLILRYEPGGFNTLHQDLYGHIFFPFQAVFVLTQAGHDHQGGEFVLTEQIPRAQSKATVLQPNRGDAVIFTTNFRPVNGSKGYYRAKMKHGVSEVIAGVRYSLGVIFHDAK